jgi:hypothetical protein
MVLNPKFPRLIAGLAFALVASAGTMASAIALPSPNQLLSQNPEAQTSVTPVETAQNVDVTEGQMQVRARVASVDAERGFIRVDIQDEEFSPNVDTIYLSENDISRLGIDVGEEVTVVYRNEQAVAVIRNDEIVRLQTGGEEGFIAEEEVDRSEVAQTTPTPTPQPMPEPEPQVTTPQATRPAPTYQQQQPQTIQQEPVPGLW